MDTLKIFRTEISRANTAAEDFRNTILQSHQSTSNRLAALESNMAITVKGIEALLKNQAVNKTQRDNENQSEKTQKPLQKQGQDP